LKELRGQPVGTGLRVCLVASRFNEEYGRLLLEGARRALLGAGVAEDDIEHVSVPGAFEIPGAAARRLELGGIDALIALGAVIRGETTHYDLIAGECARGLAELARASRVPVIFGVLTTETEEQALERAHPARQDKGGEVARAALEMVHLHRELGKKGH
jgi:6,7-dimethyl-8-ribityllumazine synthase